MNRQSSSVGRVRVEKSRTDPVHYHGVEILGGGSSPGVDHLGTDF